MKILLFNYKFLFMTLLSLPLALCSEDNDPKQDFAPVTIDLTGLNVKLEDTSFSTDGFDFKVLDAKSNGGIYDGILLAYPTNNTVSTLELDLSNIKGFSKIILSIFNNAGSTVVSLFNNGNLVEENDNIPNTTTEERFKNTILSLDGKDFNLLRITSYEAIIKSIKLE